MPNICFNDADDADLRSELDLKLSSFILQSRDPEGIVKRTRYQYHCRHCLLNLLQLAEPLKI